MKKMLFLCFAGIAAAISLYWSYDRGIMAAVFVGVLTLVFLSTRRYAEAGALFFGYLVCLLVVSLSGVAGTASENISNIMYWIKWSNEVWYMSDALKMPVVYWGGGIALFAVFVTVYALIKIYAYRLKDKTPILYGLIAVQILFLLKLFSLPTLNSFYYIWPAILVFLATQSNSYSKINENKSSQDFVSHTVAQPRPRLLGNSVGLVILLVIVLSATYFCLSHLPSVDSSYFFFPIAVVFVAMVVSSFLENFKKPGKGFGGYLVQFIDNRRDAAHVGSLLLVFLSAGYLCLWNSPLIHGFYHTWPTIIIFTVILSASLFNDSREALQDSIGKHQRGLLAGVTVANIAHSISLLLIVFATSYLLGSTIKWRNVTNSAQQILMPDRDSQIVDVNHYGFINMKSNNFDCIWQWTNEGIFSYFSKKPFCTKYTYAVYISKDSEDEILNEITKTPPKFIVFHSNNWYVSIYGRSMQNRLPLLHNFIVNNYRFDENSDGYIFATLK